MTRYISFLPPFPPFLPSFFLPIFLHIFYGQKGRFFILSTPPARFVNFAWDTYFAKFKKNSLFQGEALPSKPQSTAAQWRKLDLCQVPLGTSNTAGICQMGSQKNHISFKITYNYRFVARSGNSMEARGRCDRDSICEWKLRNRFSTFIPAAAARRAVARRRCTIVIVIGSNNPSCLHASIAANRRSLILNP